MSSLPKSPEPNDDEDRDDEEMIEAADETPTDVIAPETDEQTKDITTWDDPPTATGSAVPKVVPDDDASVGEELVYEGTDEAERERRMAAADPELED